MMMKTLACACALAAIGGAAQAESETSRLDALLAEYAPPPLWIGDEAPPITATDWLNGEPVENWAPGMIYVVDFWATWCAPCIAQFPKLTALQEAHEGSLRVVAPNIWEQASETPQVDRIESFLDTLGAPVGFTIAIDDGRTTANAWMAAAAQVSLPRTFLVDSAGTIVWIGLPQGLGDALDAVLENSGALPSADEATEAHKWELVTRYVQRAVRTGASTEASDIGWMMLNREFPKKADHLADIAFTIVLDDESPEADLALAAAAAGAACERTNWASGRHLYPLARVQHRQGLSETSVRTLRRAIDHETSESSRSLYERRLAEWSAEIGSE